MFDHDEKKSDWELHNKLSEFKNQIWREWKIHKISISNLSDATIQDNVFDAFLLFLIKRGIIE